MIKNKYAVPYEFGRNDVSMDAHNKQKIVQERSILHGSFNNHVNDSIWKIYENDVRLLNNDDSTTITINADRRLEVASGTNLNDCSTLSSRRSPLNPPNKGHLYSVGIILPNPTGLSQRDFGLFNNENGVFFRLKSDGNMYAVVRNNSIEIREEKLNPTFAIDYSKKLAYKIQISNISFGGYKFLMSNPSNGIMTEVLNIKLTEDVSLQTNSLPISYESTNLGEVSSIISVAVDLSTENFDKETRAYGSFAVPNEGIALSTQAETPAVAIQISETFAGKINSVDIALRRITASVDNNAIIAVYVTNDVSCFTGTTWTDYGSHDNIKTAVGTTDLVFTPTIYVKRLHSVRIGANQSYQITNPDETFGDLYLTAGDFLVVSLEAKNGNIGWLTVEWGEEI